MLDNGMKPKCNNFLNKLAILDIRRHADGLKNLLAEDASLKDTSLQDVIIFLFYGAGRTTSTPWVKFVHINDVSKTLSEDEINKRAYPRNELGVGQMYMAVQYFRGGDMFLSDVIKISTSAIADADSRVEAIAGLKSSAPVMPVWARVPAMTYDGRRHLRCRIDEIDMCLRDVRNNFNAQAEGRGGRLSRSNSVYHYVERKIAARELVPKPILP